MLIIQKLSSKIKKARIAFRFINTLYGKEEHREDRKIVYTIICDLRTNIR